MRWAESSVNSKSGRGVASARTQAPSRNSASREAEAPASTQTRGGGRAGLELRRVEGRLDPPRLGLVEDHHQPPEAPPPPDDPPPPEKPPPNPPNPPPEDRPSPIIDDSTMALPMPPPRLPYRNTMNMITMKMRNGTIASSVVELSTARRSGF